MGFCELVVPRNPLKVFEEDIPEKSRVEKDCRKTRRMHYHAGGSRKKNHFPKALNLGKITHA